MVCYVISGCTRFRAKTDEVYLCLIIAPSFERYSNRRYSSMRADKVYTLGKLPSVPVTRQCCVIILLKNRRVCSIMLPCYLHCRFDCKVALASDNVYHK